MGFIIWYKVQIEEESPDAGPGGLAGAVASAASTLLGIGLPVRVSNDIFSGQHILDADITLEMHTGATASTFTIKMNDLSKDTADLLKSAQKKGMQQNKPLHAKVFLGYFDDAPAPFRPTEVVMDGAITAIKSDVNDSGIMETTIKGQEITGYKLRTKRNFQCQVPKQSTADAFLSLVLDGTGVTAPTDHGLENTESDFAFDEDTALDALRVFADRRKVPIVLRDKQVFIKNNVGSGNPAATLTPEENIVKLDDSQETEEDAKASPNANTKAKTTARASFKVTVLGNPKLRVGQRVRVKLPDEDEKVFRIEECTHSFSSTGGSSGGGASSGGSSAGGASAGGAPAAGSSSSGSSTSGYTCVLTLADVQAGQLTRLQSGAHSVIRRVRDLAESTQQPAIDVGEVQTYTPGAQQKHLATLYYKQSPPVDAISPSVQTPVNKSPIQLTDRPIASPFAFHKCGLVMPIYPKMRALLAHNLGLTNDAIVTGFLWADNPLLQAPPNLAGDYWLCLPTGLTGDNLPTDTTPTANDLTDKEGRRVIQAKGLHIAVGESLLAHAGTRPTVAGDLADQIVIEHKSGTKVTITSAGEVQIQTTQQKISMTNGSVTLQLNGAAVEVT